MLKRKKRLINKKFQFRTIFSILSLVIVAYVFVIGIFGIHAIMKDREISITIEDLNKAIIMEENIVGAFIEYSSRFKGNEEILATSKITKDHKKSIDTMKKYSSLIQGYSYENYLVIVSAIFIVIIISVITFLYLAKITHRISGPIYVIDMLVQDIIDGKDPKFRELRDKDEFKEFYSKFKIMADKINTSG